MRVRHRFGIRQRAGMSLDELTVPDEASDPPLVDRLAAIEVARNVVRAVALADEPAISSIVSQEISLHDVLRERSTYPASWTAPLEDQQFMRDLCEVFEPVHRWEATAYLWSRDGRTAMVVSVTIEDGSDPPVVVLQDILVP